MYSVGVGGYCTEEGVSKCLLHWSFVHGHGCQGTEVEVCIVRNGGAIAGHVSADWSSSIVVVVVIVECILYGWSCFPVRLNVDGV